MELSQKISLLRKSMGLTLEQVGNAVGVGKSTVRKWETGDIKNMRRDKIAALAAVLNTSPAFLMGWNEGKSNLSMVDQTKVQMVPLFNSVSAGFGANADSEIQGYMPVMFDNEYDAKNSLCITVKGNSMYPKIENGDIVIVRKQEMVESGQIAVVLVEGEEGFVKKVNVYENYLELESLNPEYAPRRFEGRDIEKIQIVGLVKSIIKNCN